jgi:hypothetical protein
MELFTAFYIEYAINGREILLSKLKVRTRWKMI